MAEEVVSNDDYSHEMQLYFDVKLSLTEILSFQELKGILVLDDYAMAKSRNWNIVIIVFFDQARKDMVDAGLALLLKPLER